MYNCESPENHGRLSTARHPSRLCPQRRPPVSKACRACRRRPTSCARRLSPPRPPGRSSSRFARTLASTTFYAPSTATTAAFLPSSTSPGIPTTRRCWPSGSGAEALLAAVHAQTELKLVFLNACENYAQAAGLHAAGVQAAIVTTGEVKDDLCPTFAMRFYRAQAASPWPTPLPRRAWLPKARHNVLTGKSDLSPWLLSMPDPVAGTWRLPQRPQPFTGREPELADLLAGDIQEIKWTLARVASVSDMASRYMVGTRQGVRSRYRGVP